MIQGIPRERIRFGQDSERRQKECWKKRNRGEIVNFVKNANICQSMLSW